MCMILKLAPYRRRYCYILAVRRVDKTVLLMVDRVSSVHLRCVFSQREATRVVPS